MSTRLELAAKIVYANLSGLNLSYLEDLASGSLGERGFGEALERVEGGV